MKPTTSRTRNVVRPLAVLLLLGACGIEERDRARAELLVAQREKSELARKLATVQAEEARARGLIQAAETKAQSAQDEAAQRIADVRQRGAEIEAKARAEAEAREKDAKVQEKEVKRLTSHRDELIEWIEKELLPAAESKDPRLVNLKETATDMAAEVEKIRGLKFKRPFMRRLLSREQTVEWMTRDAKKEMTPEEVKKFVGVGAVFGLCRPDTDIAEILGQIADAGIAAFYKPETGTFYHIAGNDGRGARPVVFHELVHALDDQYFDLTAMSESVEDDSDRQIALKGLIEGSAAWHEGVYEKAHPEDLKAMVESQATPEMMAKQMKMANQVPPSFLMVMALYPYNNAKAWVGAMKPDAAVMERLFKDPPVSSEQVLHPAKFPLDGPRDYPHRVAAPDLAAVFGAGFEKLDEDNMGELMTGALLAQLQVGGAYIPTLAISVDPSTQGVGFRDPVKRAAEGWDGDRYAAWEEKATGAVSVVWVSCWDSDKDAQEFHENYTDGVGRRVMGRTQKPRPSPARFTDPKTGRVTGLEIFGNRVVAVLNAPADKAEAMLAAGLATKIEPDARDANDK